MIGVKLIERLLLTIAVLIFPVIASADETPRVVVYFPDYRLEKNIVPGFPGVTHLILFAGSPRPDGSVDFTRVSPELIDMGKKARAISGLRLQVCVGGWARSRSFAEAVSSPESRKRFVEEVVFFCQENQLDGVDIDWEFPRTETERRHLEAFLGELSGELRPNGLLLSVAVSSSHPLPEEALPFVDQVNLMSYQPWTDRPYERWLEDDIITVLESGVEASRLNLGTPFFAKEMGGERRAFPWKKMQEKGFELPASEFEFSPVGPGILDLRTQLMEKYRLGGIMIWEYGHDTTDPQSSLLHHLSEKLAR